MGVSAGSIAAAVVRRMPHDPNKRLDYLDQILQLHDRFPGWSAVFPTLREIGIGQYLQNLIGGWPAQQPAMYQAGVARGLSTSPVWVLATGEPFSEQEAWAVDASAAIPGIAKAIPSDRVDPVFSPSQLIDGAWGNGSIPHLPSPLSSLPILTLAGHPPTAPLPPNHVWVCYPPLGWNLKYPGWRFHPEDDFRQGLLDGLVAAFMINQKRETGEKELPWPLDTYATAHEQAWLYRHTAGYSPQPGIAIY